MNIVEEIALKLWEFDGGTQQYWDADPKGRKEYRYRGKLMAEYLHSKGVVIKMGRKPDVDEEMFRLITKEITKRVPDLYLDDKSAYYILEPLIGTRDA